MGAYPSVSSVSSSDVSRDVQHLKQIFPDKFSVETTEGSDSVTLFAHDGKLTLILLANATAASKGDSAALIVEESDIKTAAKHIANEKPTNSTCKKGGSKSSHVFVTQDIRLPGGSVLVLVPPAMLSTKKGRQFLTQTLSQYCGNSSEGDSSELGEDGILDNASSSASSASSAPPSAPPSGERVNVTAPQQAQQEDDRLPSFPTLDFRLLQKDNHLEPNFPLNSRKGIPFETELFKGNVMFLLRPLGDPAVQDPYWNEKIFANKQRRVIVQVQGKFKQQPQGVLYAGGEITQPMKLGLVTKGLAQTLLKLLKSFYQHVHYSFGDNDEMAHIVFPAYQFFERLVATKPGETPPTLGEPFEESDKSVRARKKGTSLGDWNTQDTYSVSFYSMYLDLPSWSVCNLPFSKDISLKTFWGKSLLRICLYDRVAPKTEKKHKPEYNKYGFVIQANYLGPQGSKSQRKVDRKVETSSEIDNDSANEEASSADEGNILDWTEDENNDRDKKSSLHMPKSESQVFSLGEDDEEDDDSVDMNQFFDAEEYRDSSRDGRIQNHSREILSSVDTLCPAWIEILHRGNYARVYALNVTRDQAVHTVFRNADAILELFEESSENICSPRMSAAERTRRHLGHLMLQNAQATNLLENMDSTDTFLNSNRPTTVKTSAKAHKSGFVARALSDHHWIEEWAIVTEQNISFYHPDRKKANHRVGIQQITKVEKLIGDAAPCFSGYSFLMVQSLGRTIYIMFASEVQRDEWHETISQLTKLDAAETSSLGDASNAALEMQNPKHEFLHKSSLWDYKHRRVLNCRRFAFSSSDQSSQPDPLALAEDALRKALDPCIDSDDKILTSFLDSAARLKQANVYDLSEDQRLVFFLNIYHCMVMHAYLVLGPPRSSFQWISYFNSISYQCSDDIFSLAELEHCIIRSNMSSPTQFLSRFVIPKSKYDFALATTSDYRINFALNPGSLSNPACVPIFKVSELHRQLEEVSRLCLSATVKVKKRSSRDVEVHLPRVCLWFSDDFGSSSEDTLKKVTRFLSNDVQECLASFQPSYKGKCTIKYSSYDYECQRLSLMPE